MKWILCLACFCSPWVLGSDLSDQVDALFRNFQGRVPGAAVIIVQNGTVTYKQAYGRQELSSDLPMTTKSNFRLASLTKSFTAAAILILIDDGILSLDRRLTDIFPDFPAYGQKITLRHLLGHTAGLRDYEGLIPSGVTEPVKDRDVLELLKKQKSGYFEPGTQYRYSNSGYAVLAEVVAKESGTSFASFLKARIFRPLWMWESVAYEKGISTVSHRAYGYSKSESGFSLTDQSLTSSVLGDGGVYTSVEGLYLWSQSWTTGRLISTPLIDQAFTSGVLSGGKKTGYGFGWSLGSYRGLSRQSHTGSTIGFRTAIQRFPEKDFMVAVLMNRANVAPWDLAERIADLYLF